MSKGVEPSLRVGVADQDHERRSRLSAALERRAIDVVLTARAPEELLQGERSLDAVVIGMDRLDTHHLDAFPQDRPPGPRVVLVAATLRREAVHRAIDAGIHGIVREDRVDEALAPTVRAARAGQLALPADWRSFAGMPVLSTRQKQVLSMVVLGLSNREVARRLYVTESTVKSHLTSAFKKLHVTSRYEAVKLILDPETGLGTGILAISDAEDD